MRFLTVSVPNLELEGDKQCTYDDPCAFYHAFIKPDDAYADSSRTVYVSVVRIVPSRVC